MHFVCVRVLYYSVCIVFQYHVIQYISHVCLLVLCFSGCLMCVFEYCTIPNAACVFMSNMLLSMHRVF